MTTIHGAAVRLACACLRSASSHAHMAGSSVAAYEPKKTSVEMVTKCTRP